LFNKKHQNTIFKKLHQIQREFEIKIVEHQKTFKQTSFIDQDFVKQNNKILFKSVKRMNKMPKKSKIYPKKTTMDKITFKKIKSIAGE
jgi:hypothetical protein